MILLGKKSHELNDTAAKYLDQNSTAGYFDELSNPAHRLSNPAHRLSNPAAQALKTLLSPRVPEQSRRARLYKNCACNSWGESYERHRHLESKAFAQGP